MTNKIAIGLFIIIFGAILVDLVFFDWVNFLYVLKKLADMIEWLAFWR